jgi:ATP-binding cassette subfamily B protein RaxB
MQIILQAEAGECGLACLAMVLSAHGPPQRLADLRQRFSTSLKGATLRQVMSMAASLGLTSRPLRVELDGLESLALPCILHWDLNHFVVLKKLRAGKATILDPAVGEKRLAFAELSRHFTGVALELSPTTRFQQAAPAPRIRLRQLTGPVQGLARALWTLFALALALECFAIVAPLYNQLVVDQAVASHDTDLLALLLAGFGFLILVQAGLCWARSWMAMVLGQTLGLQWATGVFTHLMRLPIDWFEKRHLGDIVARFGSVHTIQQAVTTAFIEALLDGIMALAALGMMLLYSAQLTLVVAAAMLVYGAVRWLSYSALHTTAAERVAAAARESTHFLETLRAMTPLKLFGRADERRAQWQNLFVEVQNRDVRSARIEIACTTANALIRGAENLLVFWLAAHAILAPASGQEPAFTLGMLFAFAAYKLQFTTRVSALIDYAVRLRMLGLHAERLADIALAPPENDTAAGDAAEDDLAGLEPSLALRGVSFRYGPDEPWILRDVDLQVRAGECLALIGPSGAGKTTLLKILLGVLKPTHGEVLYGGVPVGRLGLANVRRRIGTVMQDDVLLTGSLADNIGFFDPEPRQERIEACARLAQLHEDITAMPMGYRTIVGDLGAGLSGGQKQRLLLARALYRRPGILALDEATSHLDLANERAIAQVLKRLRLTRLVIAHRPETIAGAQRVVQVRDGHVTEVVSARSPAWPEAPPSWAA